MRRRLPPPHHHRASGQARVKFLGRHYYLGPWGSAEAERAYERLRSQIAAGNPLALGPRDAPALTVAELVAAHAAWAETHYRHPDGTPTSEVANFRFSVRPLLELHASTLAGEIGPMALREVRQRMVEAGLARKTINQRIGRIKRLFRWGVEHELVAPAVYQALAAVRGLQAGRTEARETDPVRPVSRAVVEATLPQLPRAARALVNLQLLTAARPGEVVRCRASEIDRSGPVWVYRPGLHKTAWRGRTRDILLGPRAQALIQEWLTPTSLRPDAWLFAHCRGSRYTVCSYGRAIARAAAKAGMPHWSPNQIRHLVLTEVRAQYGLEAAQVLAGHARADVTQVYAERDLARGLAVIQKIG